MSHRPLVVLALAIALAAVGCNGILGIGAPTLEADGSTEAGRAKQDAALDAHTHPDGTAGDGGTKRDGGGDATADTGTDAGHARDAETGDTGHDSAVPFNGTCSCPSMPDGGCAPVVLASGQSNPERIAVDPEAGVFWANSDQNTGSIWHTSLAGTGTSVLAQNRPLPHAIAYGQGLVFWTETLGADVSHCPYPSCTPILEAVAPNPAGVAMTKTTAYVAVGTSNSINTYSLVGGASGQLTTQASAPYSVAVDSVNVYWINTASPVGIYGCKQSGCAGPPTRYATAQSPIHLATNGKAIFWTDVDGVYSVTIEAGGVAADAAVPSPLFLVGSPGGVAVDDQHIYATSETQIMRANLDGSDVVAIATGGQPFDLALGESCVYWVDDTVGAGHVYANAK